MEPKPKHLKVWDHNLHREIKLQAIREDLSIEDLTEKVFRLYLRGKSKPKAVAA